MSRYEDELKRTAVGRVAAGESVSHVARDLKVDRRRVYAWCDKSREGGAAALRGQGRPPKAAARLWEAGEDELTALKRREAELERQFAQQQVDLAFFRQALKLVQERQLADAAPDGARSTKPPGRGVRG